METTTKELVTPAHPDIDSREELLDRFFGTTLHNAQVAIDKFKGQLDVDPVYALDWSQPTFWAAATLRVFNQVLSMLRADVAPTEVLGMCRREYRQRAGNPPSSTSQQSNLMEQAIMAAYVQAEDSLNSFIRRSTAQ